MTTFPRAESRRLYSWWWDSHISPKNSKWLQENLTDMDMKVKAMIKLIEEDADSFARRAEMYYKKRPELMKLVEEFYRAYRALAERYDHATGALRHAHRTMAEAFPNHIPLALPDESLSNNTKETPSPGRAIFDADDLHKDAFGWRGLKHVNEMPNNQDEVVARVKLPEGFDLKDLNVHDEEVRARVRLPEWKVRKSLNFDEEEEEDCPNAKIFIDSKSHLQSEINQKDNAGYGIKHLQEQISQLTNENQKLKDQIELESKHLYLSRVEVENLRDEMHKLESEKVAAFLQDQVSVETISSLEIEISKLKNEIRKLNEEMEMAVLKLSGVEQKCLALEKANQSLQSELEETKSELEELRNSLNVKNQKLMEAEMSLQSKDQLYNQSNEKIMLMTLEIQSLVEKLMEVERSKGDLEAEVSQLKDLNSSLNEHNLACALKMKNLEDEIVSLKEINGKLENEIENQVESNKRFQQEFESLKDEKNEIEINHQILTKEMEAASIRIESLETQVKDLQYGHSELKDCCSMLEEEKLHILDKLKDMESVSGRNSVLENSLSDANVELEELRKKIIVLEELCESLNASVSTHVGEKTSLAFQIETLAINVDNLSDKNMFLENSLDDANTELEGLRSKLRGSEESFLSLSHANSDLIAQKNDLISQVESIQQNLINFETTHATLEEKHLNLVKEKDLSVNKILNLEDSLNAMHREHDSVIISKNMSLANLENQLLSLQEDGKLREEELEAEKQRSFSHMTQIFVLQRFLHEISNSLVLEKQKYKSLIRSSEIQSAALENQIHLLQEERKFKDEKIVEEEQKSMNSMLEIFILQRCLSEVKGENFTLLQECQKHLEASRSADELIKQLEDKELIQKEKITLLKEHISKVRDFIQFLLEPLNIDKELMNSEGSEFFILPTIFGEIKNLLSSISNIRDENQVLCMEILVYLSFLKQTGAEKVLLSRELEKVKKQLVVLQREHLQLYDEYDQLCHDASAADFTNITLKAELEIFTRKLVDSSEKVCNLMEKKISLEEENSLMWVEAMTLENLYLFYKSLNTENMKQLELLSGDTCSLLTVKNGLDEEIGESKAKTRALESENKQLEESLVFFKELRSQITISEFDLHFARSFCEELNLEVEAGENSLRQKSMELLKVNDVLQSKEGEFTELCRELEVSIKEVDEAKIMRSELDNKITALLEGATSRDKQIASFKGENEVLNEELNKFKLEVEALKLKEQNLLCELHEEKQEVDHCEEEIMELVGEVQANAINAAMFEEKMFELASHCEGLDLSAMVLRETLKEEIILKNSHEVELKKKVYDFENENGKLRNDLKVLFRLFCSLENGISDVEKNVWRLRNFDEGYQEKSSSYHQENNAKIVEDHDHSTMLGVSKMQNLISKVEALQQLAAGAKSHLDQERVDSAAKLHSARKEIQELKLKESSIIENQGKEASNTVKDIELDQVSNSFGASRNHGVDATDPNYNHLVSTDHGIEAVDEASKNEKPSSELSSEKDLSVYKMEISTEFKESQKEWNIRVMKRLSYDAEKLTQLQLIAQELNLKMEKYGTSARKNKLQFDTLKLKLRDAEEAIFNLIDRNGRLMGAVEGDLDSYNSEEMRRSERSRVLEQARSASERIGMVELELQKIDYIFLKLQEEWENSPTKGGDRTPRVLLRDYLYGRKNKLKKKGYFCGCVRPKTQDNFT